MLKFINKILEADKAIKDIGIFYARCQIDRIQKEVTLEGLKERDTVTSIQLVSVLDVEGSHLLKRIATCKSFVDGVVETLQSHDWKDCNKAVIASAEKLEDVMISVVSCKPGQQEESLPSNVTRLHDIA